MNRKIKAKIKRLLLLFVLKHLEIVNPHNISLLSRCYQSRVSDKIGNQISDPRTPWLTSASMSGRARERTLVQAKLSKSLCVVKCFMISPSSASEKEKQPQ